MVLTDKILLIFSGLGAKLDFMDLSLEKFKDVFQSQSISELRKKMIGILKEVFKLVQEYSIYFKKAFYIVSLILIVHDAYRYYSGDISLKLFSVKYMSIPHIRNSRHYR